jgi:guanylate kinase
MALIVTLSGVSGAGKSRLKSSLGFPHITTATSREPRDGEVHGKDYYFLKKQLFWNLYHKGLIIEKNDYEGNLYGMFRKVLEKIKTEGSVYAVVCELNGVDFLKDYFGDANVLSIYLKAPLESVERRLTERILESEDYIKRYNRAKQELSSEYISNFDVVIENGDGTPFEQTISTVTANVARSIDALKDLHQLQMI